MITINITTTKTTEEVKQFEVPSFYRTFFNRLVAVIDDHTAISVYNSPSLQYVQVDVPDNCRALLEDIQPIEKDEFFSAYNACIEAINSRAINNKKASTAMSASH